MVLTLLLLCLGALRHAEAGEIDISNGNLTLTSWGPGAGGPSYGQTFTVPAGDFVLLDYSFSLESSNARFPFVSQAYAWNVTGPAAIHKCRYTQRLDKRLRGLSCSR